MRFSILSLILWLSSCGSDTHVIEKYKEVPQPPPPPPGVDPGRDDGELNFTQMKVYLDKYCLACHATAPFMQSEQALRASSAEDQIWTERMPPSNAPTPLPDKERGIMLNFF